MNIEKSGDEKAVFNVHSPMSGERAYTIKCNKKVSGLLASKEMSQSGPLGKPSFWFGISGMRFLLSQVI
jgi:hypothetical protein